jgi:sec-independent protein translocase protein TatA
MGLGPWHLMALIIIVLVFFGPSRLPTLGKSMGEAIRGFKKGLEGEEIDITPTAKRENLSAPQNDNITQHQAQGQAQSQQHHEPQAQTQQAPSQASTQKPS